MRFVAAIGQSSMVNIAKVKFIVLALAVLRKLKAKQKCTLMALEKMVIIGHIQIG